MTMIPIPDATESQRRNATTFILRVMVLGGIIATLLHLREGHAHTISLVLPPLTTLVCSGLLFYLHRYRQKVQQVIRLTLIWIGFVILFPEYFFVIEAFLHPEKKLIEILPPITSCIFPLTMSMIIFLRPQDLAKKVFLLWVITAAPIVGYLILNPQELQAPRGIDLLVSLVPSMGVNLSLLIFYLQLQDTVDKLASERSHLKEISEKDALTKIFNRAAGEKMLQTLIDQSIQNIGIIICDIDRFKHINDTYGHLAGDRVLLSTAQSCQVNLRKQDTLVRWGGEEFLVVVSGDDSAALVQLAERLRQVIANQSIPDVGSITASFGVAFRQPQEDRVTLFSRADRALYQAKALGRNQVVCA